MVTTCTVMRETERSVAKFGEGRGQGWLGEGGWGSVLALHTESLVTLLYLRPLFHGLPTSVYDYTLHRDDRDLDLCGKVRGGEGRVRGGGGRGGVLSLPCTQAVSSRHFSQSPQVSWTADFSLWLHPTP